MLVVLLSRADKAVVGNVKLVPEVPKELRHLVAIVLRIPALAPGLALHVEAVLVQAREEERIIPFQAAVARLHVAANGAEGRANMRLGIGVVNGGGQIVGRHVSAGGFW